MRCRLGFWIDRYESEVRSIFLTGLQSRPSKYDSTDMTPERYHKIRATLELRQPDLTLLTDRVEKGRNIAAMRRSCDAFAVGEMHAVVAEDYLPRRHAGITAGTHKRVRLFHHKSLAEPITKMRSRGMRIVATDLSDAAVDYQQYDFTQPTAILMGSELFGVSDEAKQLADDLIHIPMRGLVESLNVSVAFAIILSEACRQRSEAGMFDKPRMTKEEIDRITFEWGYPKLKNYYQGKGLAYPELDQDGQIISK